MPKSTNILIGIVFFACLPITAPVQAEEAQPAPQEDTVQAEEAQPAPPEDTVQAEEAQPAPHEDTDSKPVAGEVTESNPKGIFDNSPESFRSKDANQFLNRHVFDFC